MEHLFGLLAYAGKHSFSPSYFTSKFKKLNLTDHHYSLLELQKIEDFSQLNWKDYKGLNVTIPYKQSIIEYLDELSPLAQELGAVNTIVLTKNNRKIGFNTDVYGFTKSLSSFLNYNFNHSAIILGSGGASQAVQYVLNSLGIHFILVSRNGPIKYEMINEEMIKSSALIINTTPLGMFPKEETKPDIPYVFLSERHYLFDLVYNPKKTLFLKEAEKKNAQIKNGLEMLALQAEKSWEIWNNY